MRVYRRTILSVCNPLINWKSHRRHGLVYGGKVIAYGGKVSRSRVDNEARQTAQAQSLPDGYFRITFSACMLQ
jgi:hypothetical protein